METSLRHLFRASWVWVLALVACSSRTITQNAPGTENSGGSGGSDGSGAAAGTSSASGGDAGTTQGSGGGASLPPLQLVYRADEDEPNDYHFYRADVSGETVTRVELTPSLEPGEQFSNDWWLSPGGDVLLYEVSASDAQRRLAVPARAPGSAVEVLPDLDNHEVVWLDASHSLHCDGALHVVSWQGAVPSEGQRLTAEDHVLATLPLATPACGRCACWPSPDGQKIAYVDESTDEVWLADVMAAGAPTRIGGPAHQSSVSWSPDGSRVFWVPVDQSETRLYFVDISAPEAPVAVQGLNEPEPEGTNRSLAYVISPDSSRLAVFDFWSRWQVDLDPLAAAEFKGPARATSSDRLRFSPDSAWYFRVEQSGVQAWGWTGGSWNQPTAGGDPPLFAPDGSVFALFQGQGSGVQLFRYDEAPSESPVELLPSAASAYLAFAPDSSALLVIARTDAASELFEPLLFDLSERLPVPIPYGGEGGASLGLWHPSLPVSVLVRAAPGASRLYLRRLDAAEPVQVNGEGVVDAFAFLP